MTGETLQKAIRNQPFRPFVIHMADGRALPVTHPELIAYKTGSRTAIVVYEDSFEFLDLLLILLANSYGAREAADYRPLEIPSCLGPN